MTDESLFKHSRAAARERVLLGATVIAATGTQQVRVRDLSRSGAQIISEQPLQSGTDVIFKRAKTFAAAKVIWANDSEAGLQFYRDLD